jgi:deoxyribonuclease V
MIACLDVDYKNDEGLAACLIFEQWHSASAANTYAAVIDNVAPYEAGAFYKRELPCLLEVLSYVSETLDFIIVDSYVWLDNQHKKGMGAYLYQSLKEKIPVIGVAKTEFVGANEVAVPIIRGDSKVPLFITAAGVNLQWAAHQIQQMHGNFRLPTLLKEVDRLCRSL